MKTFIALFGILIAGCSTTNSKLVAHSVNFDNPTKLTKVTLEEKFGFSVSMACGEDSVMFWNDQQSIRKEDSIRSTLFLNDNCAYSYKGWYEVDRDNKKLELHFSPYSPSGSFTLCECGAALTFDLNRRYDGYKVIYKRDNVDYNPNSAIGIGDHNYKLINGVISKEDL